MNLTDFDYELPAEFIAQTPIEPRDASRLMVLDRSTGAIIHTHFHEIGNFLRPGDLLVLNDTRVIPARLWAKKANTGGRVELLLLERRAPLTWETLVGGKGVHVGSVLEIEGHSNLRGIVMQAYDGPRRLVQFSQPISSLLDQIGAVPLPPYIREPLADPERYQTVYAKAPGSAAAPTAGLHFTPALIEKLQALGVQIAHVTLHVGLDTFAPVTEERVEDHPMHGEWCELTAETAALINAAKREGRRVIAVGTTSVRTLESAQPGARVGEVVAPLEAATGLFILPGHQFRVVDATITNFHLPRSTLLMLVSAFAGREQILAAYEEAKRQGYRFYSFGDAMLIL
ncbi:MAG: tRNA preQ1(34) S-adenosylmethionine ribosyltransferase-isomerase QueA [Anaerolineales bacterium]